MPLQLSRQSRELLPLRSWVQFLPGVLMKRKKESHTPDPTPDRQLSYPSGWCIDGYHDNCRHKFSFGICPCTCHKQIYNIGGPEKIRFYSEPTVAVKENKRQNNKRLRSSCINKSRQSRLLDRWEQKSRLDNPAIAGRKPKLLNAKNARSLYNCGRGKQKTGVRFSPGPLRERKYIGTYTRSRIYSYSKCHGQ